MEKLNIAEILMDCPKGMELDCTMYDNVTLISVDKKDTDFPIKVSISDGHIITLTKYGQYTIAEFAKCVIFPKGKTTWEGFQRPFKDGDIITCTNSICSFVAIFKEKNTNTTFRRYVSLTLDDSPQFKTNEGWSDFSNPRFATEEEKQKLLKVIKDNGYKWNAETKTLEKLIVPKFKVGDRIQFNNERPIRIIKSLEYDRYRLDNGCYIKFGNEGAYKLLKFNISTLKPFDKVLVRDYNGHHWRCALYERYDNTRDIMYFATIIGHYQQCIPFEGNEHLLGTSNDCDEYYKNWE